MREGKSIRERAVKINEMKHVDMEHSRRPEFKEVRQINSGYELNMCGLVNDQVICLEKHQAFAVGFFSKGCRSNSHMENAPLVSEQPTLHQGNSCINTPKGNSPPT